MVLEGSGDNGWVAYDDEPAPAQGNRSSGGFFLKTVKREEPYKIRIVTPAVRFYKHFVAFKSLPDKAQRMPISPATNPNEKYKDAAWEKGDYLPTKRFGMLVIDREDGKVKIYEAGGGVWASFNDYAKLTGINPASHTDGPDFIIKVSASERADGSEGTEYSCIADPRGSKPLTSDEIAEVESFIASRERYSQEKHNSDLGWKWYFKPMSPEAMRELWMSLPEDRRIRKKKDKAGPSQAPKTASKPAPQTQAAPPAKKAPAPAAPPPKEEAPVQTTDYDGNDAPETPPTEDPFF